MARYEHLPIFKAALDCSVLIERQVGAFSRAHRFAIGADLRRHSQQILICVLRAQSCDKKVPHLEKLRDTAEQFKILLRIAKECKAFHGLSAFVQAIEQAETIARQSEGWLKSERGKHAGTAHA
ncbi:MAG: four helix bundle protein [Spirochaetes bacterium]|jgi:hypothetical protein|nr:four helix bundle protein [Spirochaetota bacterium]